MRRTWSTSISATQLRSTAGANTGIITGPSAVGGAALGGGVAAAATEAAAALEGEGASAEAEAATRGTRGAKAAPKEPGGARATASRRAAVSAFFHVPCATRISACPGWASFFMMWLA